MDIFHKSPDTRQHRWWGIPTATQAYKDAYDRIFKKKPVKKKPVKKKPTKVKVKK